MDLMRYFLALAVFVAHFGELNGFHFPFIISSFDAVGGFFALSGFLVYHGFERNRRLTHFIARRAERILPPYLFVVIGAALGLSLISSLPASEYFTDPGFWKYLTANIFFLNWLHPDLPGVFDSTNFAFSAVNGSLWTMKIEWCLYLSVPLVAWTALKLRNRSKPLFLFIIVSSILYRFLFTRLAETNPNPIFIILARQVFGQLSYFYIGALIYSCREWFCRHLAVLALIFIPLFIACRFIPYGDILLNPFSVSVLVLDFSLVKRSLRWLQHRNNVSYEIYLFHFPVIQTAIALNIPELGLPAAFAFSLASSVLLAIIAHYSWLAIRRKWR